MSHRFAALLLIGLTACGGDDATQPIEDTLADVTTADVEVTSGAEDAEVTGSAEDAEVTGTAEDAEVMSAEDDGIEDDSEDAVACTPASVVSAEGVAWGTPCCPEDSGLEEVYKPDGCNWCSCVGSDEGQRWECTATICTDDADAGAPSPDAAGPQGDTGPTPDATG